MKGFTLIEVIVAVAIALMVTGFILVNYNSYNDVQTLKQAALTLKNNLRFAESKALSGQKPTPTPPTPTPTPTPMCIELSGYTVSFTENSYTIQAKCNNNPEAFVGDTVSVALPKGVIFSPVPATPVTFSVLSRTDLPSGLCLTLTGSGKSYSLGVESNGELNDFGLNYSGQCP